MSNSTQNKCPFCNSELISLVLPSNPPQYKTHCPNCENSKVSNSTQNDWKKRFWEYYEGRQEKDGYINPSFLLLFIAKELADARREVIKKVEKMKKNGWDLSKIDYGFIDQGYNQAIDDVLATLKEGKI